MVFCLLWQKQVRDHWAVSIATKGYIIPFKIIPKVTSKVKKTRLLLQDHFVLLEEIDIMLEKQKQWKK